MKFLEKIFQHPFYKPFLILSGGTFVAQIIQIISYPFVTRLFSPEDFGIKAFFASTLVLASTISTGKYELAIPIPKRDEAAATSVFVSIFLSSLMAIASIFLIFFFGEKIIRLAGRPIYFLKYLWWIPVGILGMSVMNAMIHWAIRRGNFKLLSTTKIIQSSSKAVLEVSGGFLNFGAIILVWGVLLGACGGVFLMVRDFYKNLQKLSISIGQYFQWQRLREHIIRFRDFPKYAVLAGFFNQMNHHLPVLFFTFFSTLEITGQYSIALLVVSIPSALISESFSKIFLSQMSALMNLRSENLEKYFFSSLQKAIGFGGLLIVGFFILGKPFVQFAFGDQWILAGELTRVMGIFLAARILFFLAFHVFNLLEFQRLLMKINAISFIFLLGGFVAAWHFELATLPIILIFAIIHFLMSIVQIWISYKKLKSHI